MVFFGGWRRRPRYYDPYADYGRRPRWYGGGFGPAYGRGSSVMRDLCLVESGCCLAEALGCGPQLILLTPLLMRPTGPVAGTVAGPLAGAATVPVTSAAGTSSGRRAVRDSVRDRLIAAIRVYQVQISPHRPGCCVYTPTCSRYALEALQLHPLGHALRLAAGRLLRCRPGSPGGADPVPR